MMKVSILLFKNNTYWETFLTNSDIIKLNALVY